MMFKITDPNGKEICSVESTNPTRSEEGLFGLGKKIIAYVALEENETPREERSMWALSTPKRCVRNMFKSFDINGVDEKQTLGGNEININEYGSTKIIVKAKNKNKLNTKVCLYKIEVNPKAAGGQFKTTMDKYGLYVNQQMLINVLAKETGTVLEFAKKYGVDFVIDDSVSLNASILKKIYQEAVKSVTPVIKDLDGFNIYADEDELESFYEGDTKCISLIRCDAWEFTGGKARDSNEYDKYTVAYNKVVSDCTKALKSNSFANKYFAKIDYDGDWDDGSIQMIIK